MIPVNLNEENLLKYKVSNIDKVKKASLIVQFSNNIVYKFEGVPNIETEEIYIKLPILKNVIKTEIEAKCYLEIGDDTRFFKVEEDSILFQFVPTVNIQFEDINKPVEATLISKNEIALDMQNVQVKKVNYNKVVAEPKVTKKRKT